MGYYTEDLTKQANKKFAYKSIQWFAEFNLLHLEYIGEHGLPDCYKDFKEFLFDFYPDFSWNKRMKDEIRVILTDSRFPEIEKKIKKAYAFDIRKELEKAAGEIDIRKEREEADGERRNKI